MARKEMTLVHYHVPEDKDDPDCPNVFGVPQAIGNLKLVHIHQNFPLKGSYLFRFKIQHDGQGVWLDLPHVDSKIPQFRERVVMKATRVSWNQSKLHQQYRQRPSKVIQSSQKAEKVNFFENNNSNGQKTQVKQQQEAKMFNLMDNSPTTTAKKQPSADPPGFNLLDEGHGSSSQWGQKKVEMNLLQ